MEADENSAVDRPPTPTVAPPSPVRVNPAKLFRLRKIFALTRPPPPTPPALSSIKTSTESPGIPPAKNSPCAPNAGSSTQSDALHGDLDNTASNHAIALNINTNSPARAPRVGAQLDGTGSSESPGDHLTSGDARPQETAPVVSGIFPGAHHITVNNPTFVYNTEAGRHIDDFMRNVDEGGTVLLILEKSRIRGAEADASDRSPPPRCHPLTRREMRGNLARWVDEAPRNRNFIWLEGPAGAGKTAVAQTFAEYLSELGKLGASFFFSRVQNRVRMEGLVATLAYQLALQDAGYNHLITRILSRDPSILDKTLRIQFNKLITEPLGALALQQSAAYAVRKALVIIVDGLDECNSHDAQRELITLISHYTRLSAASTCPLLWLVCSRPEWHIKGIFAQAHPPINYDRQKLTCNAEQDEVDVYHILKDGLQEIFDEANWEFRQNSHSIAPWPAEVKLKRLTRGVAGLPVLASTVLRFIEAGSGSGALENLLDTCLDCLEAKGSDENPLAALDAFYMQILLRIPDRIRSTTMQIISVQIYFQDLDLFQKPAEIGCFLCSDQEAFYAALRSLHSVLSVPLPDRAFLDPLYFYHKSFVDFLEDPERSESFFRYLDKTHIGTRSLRWYSHFLQANCQLGDCDCKETLLDGHYWAGHASNLDDHINRARLSKFVQFNCWDLCTNLCLADPKGALGPDVESALYDFNFCHLPVALPITAEEGFSDFLIAFAFRMAHDDKGEDLIRFKPTTHFDTALVRAIEAFEPLPLRDSFPKEMVNGHPTFRFFSLHRFDSLSVAQFLDSGFDPSSAVMAFWIGKGERTALALLFGF
ncbi:hypothetical protein NP233_g12403 [Leucocoprinus birnbaumii]|uniref:NACHT domain-containing protein n=1 Tax=Leucocoprinus birnbaumii TaxID=56174 RepID=A0AAD5YN38_9AGAR|nr:hypothetical protein NP233_g12403 [Leucocoprinus birnbaumii]